jgi:hypothetical protein
MSKLLQALEAEEQIGDLEEKLQEISLYPSEFAAVHALLVFIRTEKLEEAYLGGEGNARSLLQLTSRIDESDQIDIMATLLLSGLNSVTTPAVARKQAALNLAGLFWRRYPEAPVLIECSPGDFGHVLCGIEGEASTWGPFNLTNWRSLETRSTDSITFMRPERRTDEDALTDAAAIT